MPAFEVPTIDIRNFEGGTAHQRAAIGRVIDDTFTQVGFLSITGHGVAPATIASAERAAREFFALPLAEKMRSMKEDRVLNRGFMPAEAEAVGRSRAGDAAAPHDLKEAFLVGRLDAPTGAIANAQIQFAPNIWPAAPVAFRERVTAFYLELERLAFRLMRVFACALRLPEDFLAPHFAAHNALLRLQHYPAQREAPLPGQLRIGAHTDYGAFTILKADPNAGGLQVEAKSGDWIDVGARADAFIVNLGDLMKTWTNDRWQSNPHRVVNPRDASENVDRLTFPFFVNPSFDARIECLPTCIDPGAAPLYPPMLAGEHRMAQLRKTA